jgi:hypothetical protein
MFERIEDLLPSQRNMNKDRLHRQRFHVGIVNAPVENSIAKVASSVVTNGAGNSFLSQSTIPSLEGKLGL